MFTIIVSGHVFEVSKKCLENFPDTLLGNSDKRKKYFDPRKRALFFDRHRLAFEGILMYYQTLGKRIKCPDNVPREVFEEELEFFGIQHPLREKCKTIKYIINPLPDLEQQNLKSRLWILLQHPESSRYGQILSGFSLCVTVFSVILAVWPNSDIKQDADILLFEHFCFGWFAVEYLLRFWAAPKKWMFCRSLIDMVDLSTILIFYSTLMLSMADAGVGVLRIFRLASVFRILKLTRYSYGLRLLMYSVYQSRMELQICFSYLNTFILVSASMVYYTEANDEYSSMKSIPEALWWSIVTTTTVGYGDYVPVTGTGKLVGVTTAIFGVLMVIMPVLKLTQTFCDALEVSRPYLRKHKEKSPSGPVTLMRIS